MNPDLEALLKAMQALQEARGETETTQRKTEFDTLLDQNADRCGVSREALKQAIQRQYWKWIKAQHRHPTLPPNA